MSSVESGTATKSSQPVELTQFVKPGAVDLQHFLHKGFHLDSPSWRQVERAFIVTSIFRSGRLLLSGLQGGDGNRSPFRKPCWVSKHFRRIFSKLVVRIFGDRCGSVLHMRKLRHLKQMMWHACYFLSGREEEAKGRDWKEKGRSCWETPEDARRWLVWGQEAIQVFHPQRLISQGMFLPEILIKLLFQYHRNEIGAPSFFSSSKNFSASFKCLLCCVNMFRLQYQNYPWLGYWGPAST